jgi:hypothetical protein
MTPIVEMRFGSHLYGTDTPDSDLDLKAVFLPAARDILLQRVPRSIASGPAKAPRIRNTSSDVDREAYSLQRYLELLAEGQTVALDMLFAPDSAMTMPPAPMWREIQAHAPRLVSRRATSFVRYCRQQANKYGIKGSRIATARRALGLLQALEQRLGTTARLGEAASELAALTDGEHASIVELPAQDGRQFRYLDVCGRRMAFTASIKSARDIVQRMVDEYGHRALQAERDQGIDWKALSHAVRVGQEALELFATGRIVFPLAGAAHLLRIKQGALPYDQVASEIEALLAAVEQAAATSTLPEAPDQELIDNLVLRAYRSVIMQGA